MHFDYTIVLVFVIVGGLVALRRRPMASPEAKSATQALSRVVFLAAIALLLPWALVLRDCLHDSGPAQSRGIGAFALFAGGLFIAILSLGFAYARESE